MENWHIKLFNKSIIKQLKFRYLTEYCGGFQDKRCLDLGSDNGIISYLLRQKGGKWSSADIDETAVQSIKNLCDDEVYLIDPLNLPFSDEEFDLVVIVDLLEHVIPDQNFLNELSRTLKKSGTLIVNVPNIKKFSLIRAVRNLLGLTDEQHGHVRPGYTLNQLKTMLPEYQFIRSATYSKFFLELIDMAISFGMHILSKGKENKKGVLVTEKEVKKYKKLFLIYSILYPFMWVFSKLDILLAPFQGYRLIAEFKKGEAAK